MESQRHYLERRALEEEAAAQRASNAKAREIHIELASRYRVAADTDAPARPEPRAQTILPTEFRILD
ncbi:MAG TPA: hypothetical protein VKA61_04200 [Sphingomicrobium sp.]|nr:hypothetical protein [Sphingomicrobium sp.]